MKTIRYFCVAMLMTVILGGSGLAQSVTVDYDHNANFERYHTYFWLKVKTSNPLWKQRIQDAVDNELQKKGWQKVDTGGDVALTAVGSADTDNEYVTFYNNLGDGWWWSGFGTATTETVTYEVGTLVLDVYDAQTKRLIWRGVATKTLSKKPEKNEKALEKAVEKMFKNFPPKK
jgi:hypothetical protein